MNSSIYNPDTSPTLAQAQELLRQYPYFILPLLQAAKANGLDSLPEVRRTPLLQRLSICFNSQQGLSRALGEQAPLFDNFYPDERVSTPDTMDTIDTFLSNFGASNPNETEALEKLIFSGTPDYGAVLAAEEKNSVPSSEELADPNLSEQEKLINSFIAANHSPAPPLRQEKNEKPAEIKKSEKQNNEKPAVEKSAKNPETAPLTESLVRILIKNRNYSKAIEIISELSLNNPKKSIYFADQIRFLRKLIINENKK
ncbi:MAG: hypothetical protein NC402_01300 [Prevotella sp.]|nr:hypothetical protein [Prevotella sp.]MCM1074499.1 hypothetical protein [Ruminococcus sp.]